MADLGLRWAFHKRDKPIPIPRPDTQELQACPFAFDGIAHRAVTHNVFIVIGELEPKEHHGSDRATLIDFEIRTTAAKDLKLMTAWLFVCCGPGRVNAFETT